MVCFGVPGAGVGAGPDDGLGAGIDIGAGFGIGGGVGVDFGVGVGFGLGFGFGLGADAGVGCGISARAAQALSSTNPPSDISDRRVTCGLSIFSFSIAQETLVP